MAKKQHKGPSGLIVVDKPAGMTSHDVVSRVRRLAQTRKVGHAGTLDPMATGVLILGIGKATKLLTWIVGESKTYTATIRLGISTVTDDVEGEIIEFAEPKAIASIVEGQIRAEVEKLTGDIMQVPASVSAIKVDGVRSYSRVREGQDVQLDARPVTISEFAVHSIDRTSITTVDVEGASVDAQVIDLDVTVSCSSGTYIRSLARDLGNALGVGGHLTSLRRTRIGEIQVGEAHTLDALAELREQEQPLPLLPLEDAAAHLFGVRELSAQDATDISFGRRIEPSASAHQRATNGGSTDGITAAYAPNQTLVALIENKTFRGQPVAAPLLVFEASHTFEENPA